MTGETISRYRILEKLGEGGMGVVYKAEDVKLKRPVALKFLPKGLEEHRERFLREAQAAAALNHPNICTIHEIDDEHGFIAMELVEGKTLKDKIAERPLPLKEALDIAEQVCTGLQHAHEKGVVHRDIKPANIIVSDSGQIKIMDFGLAQVGDRTRITKTGASLGTPAYMSPEQVKGEPADRRTDIWSLGVVLYEALTQKLPFPGETDQALAYAIVHAMLEPPTAKRGGLPMALDRILAKTLEKDSSRRYQNVADLAVDIRTIEAARPIAAGPSRHLTAAPWAIAALASLAVVAMLFRPQTTPAARTSRLSMSLPAGQILVTTAANHPIAISPDGSKLVYAATSAGSSHLYIRTVNSFDSQVLPGTDGAMDPFWSPDGQWIGFESSSKLKKVSPAGGAPISICDLPGRFMGATWLGDGSIIAAVLDAGLMHISGTGGGAKLILAPANGSGERFQWPRPAPDGKAILFTVFSMARRNRLAVYAPGDKSFRVLLDGQQGDFAKSGHLVYSEEGGLRAVRFNPDSATVVGSPVPLIDDVFEAQGSGAAYFTISGDGTVYYPPGRNEHNLVWVDRAGRISTVTKERRGYRFPKLSPDGSRIAVVIDPANEEQSHIWLFDVARGAFTRLTTEDHNLHPVWSPDGKRIAHSSSAGLTLRSLDSGKAIVVSSNSHRGNYPYDWSSDGRTIVGFGTSPATKQDIWTLAATGAGGIQPFAATAFNEKRPKLSTNGRWIAYQSDESGRDEVYVQPFPAGGRKHAVSTEGGGWPCWSRDGNELFYIIGDTIMSVAVSAGAEFRAGKPEVLFERHDLTAGRGQIDVGRDRDHFLMIQWDPLSSPREIRVITNWFAELVEKAGAQ